MVYDITIVFRKYMTTLHNLLRKTRIKKKIPNKLKMMYNITMILCMQHNPFLKYRIHDCVLERHNNLKKLCTVLQQCTYTMVIG